MFIAWPENPVLLPRELSKGEMITQKRTQERQRDQGATLRRWRKANSFAITAFTSYLSARASFLITLPDRAFNFIRSVGSTVVRHESARRSWLPLVEGERDLFTAHDRPGALAEDIGI